MSQHFNNINIMCQQVRSLLSSEKNNNTEIILILINILKIICLRNNSYRRIVKNILSCNLLNIKILSRSLF